MNLLNAKIYVGTYHKYNSGSIAGEWVDLEDFEDTADFYEYCREIHKDEKDPEFMFQDYENIPENLVSESHLDAKFFEIRNELLYRYDSADLEDENLLLSLNSEFGDTFVFDDPEELVQGMDPFEAFRAGCFSDINWGDNYFYFNGYGNIESCNDITAIIDVDYLIDCFIESL